ncbi:MAG TPA: hypothetical protein VF331_23640 [Polyangiales bacterium]
MPSLASTALRRFGYPAALLGLLALGFVLRSPVLSAGFYADDFDHHAMQVGHYPVPRGRFDMFNFGNGSSAENRVLMQSGHFPWWSDPHIHLSMFRPLSSALIAFDFAAFGLDARFFHLHSFVWWGVLVVAAAWLLAELLPTPIALLALFFFVLEEGHDLPVGWLANRSPLVATTFGLLALRDHIAWRNSGSTAARWRSLGFCVLALSAGEYALSALAFLAAFELFGRNDALQVRVRALLPVAAAGLGYLVLRQSLGYGIEGSGFYISPSATPLSFLVALCWRIPVLTGDLMLGVVADWYTAGTPWRAAILRQQWFSPEQWRALPDWHTWQVLIGGVCLATALALVRWLPKLTAATTAAAARWLFAGAVLSLVPVSGGMAAARLTVAASLGFDVLFAVLLASAAQRIVRAGILGRIGAALGCFVLLYLHGFQAAQRAQIDSYSLRFRSRAEQAWVLSADLDDRKLSEQSLAIVAAQDLGTAWYIPYILQMAGRPMPRAAWLLSGAGQAHDLERVADNAVDLTVITSHVDGMAVGSNFRPADKPFQVGDQVRVPGFVATVLSTLHGQPQRVRFDFPSSLDDGHYVFLFPGERGLRQLSLPAVGGRLRLRSPVYPNDESFELLRQDREAEQRASHPPRAESVR